MAKLSLRCTRSPVGIDHVVAQVIEAELVVGPVGDVGGVGGLLVLVRHLREVDADRQAKKAVQASHPFRIAVGQVVVDRHHMHAIAGQRIEVGGQRCDQRLAFAGAHFGDLPVVQDHAADQLDVEVAHAQAFAGLANDGEGFRQQRIQRLTIGRTGLEFGRLAAQALVGQRADTCFQRVDLADNLRVLLDQPIIAAAENLLE
jgi:hypothetical protein